MNGNASVGLRIAIGCGSILLLLAICTTCFFSYHVFIDPHGAISDDEAAPGMIGGALCAFVDLIIVGVGIALAMRASSASGSQPGMPGAPGMPAAPARPAGPFPFHFLSGCATLGVLLTACLAFGGVPYFYSEMQHWEHMRDEDLVNATYLVDIDEAAIARRQERMMMSGACGAFALFVSLGGIAGTFLLARRHRAQQQA